MVRKRERERKREWEREEGQQEVLDLRDARRGDPWRGERPDSAPRPARRRQYTRLDARGCVRRRREDSARAHLVPCPSSAGPSTRSVDVRNNRRSARIIEERRERREKGRNRVSIGTPLMGSAFTRVHSRIYNATRFSRGNRVVTITARGQLYPSIEQIDRSVGHSLARSTNGEEIRKIRWRGDRGGDFPPGTHNATARDIFEWGGGEEGFPAEFQVNY